ncbi:MAG: hypothetical protein Q8R13_02975 [bacterium]|nr:hypothetical protein [bacterium]
MAAGNIDVIAVFGLIAGAILLFSLNMSLSVRAGVILHMASSIVFIGALLRLLPESYPLRINESAPIFIIFLLLAGNVTVLFLWHQLQVHERKRINVWGDRKTVLGLIVCTLVVFGYWLWSSQSGKTAVYYQSERYGYSISLPRYWSVDATQSDYPAESIKNPGGDVTLFIQRLPTPHDVDEATVRGAIREELEKNPYHEPEVFEGRTWHGYPAYYAEGIYRDERGELRFYEYNAFLDDLLAEVSAQAGRSVFTVRVNVKVSAGDTHQKGINRILDSLVLK